MTGEQGPPMTGPSDREAEAIYALVLDDARPLKLRAEIVRAVAVRLDAFADDCRRHGAVVAASDEGGCQGSRETETHCPHWFDGEGCCGCRLGQDDGGWCPREPLPSWATQYADTLVPGRGAHGINLRDDAGMYYDRRGVSHRIALALKQAQARGSAAAVAAETERCAGIATREGHKREAECVRVKRESERTPAREVLRLNRLVTECHRIAAAIRRKL